MISRGVSKSTCTRVRAVNRRKSGNVGSTGTRNERLSRRGPDGWPIAVLSPPLSSPFLPSTPSALLLLLGRASALSHVR